MPMSPAGNDPAYASAGFTLVEVLAALVILALLASMVTVNTTRTSDRAAAAHLAIETADLARGARNRAIRSGRDEVLLIDLDTRRIGGSGGKAPLKVADVVDIHVAVSAGERTSATIAGIRFFANGMSTGGTIRFSQLGRQFEVRVNWFTGRVSMVQLS